LTEFAIVVLGTVAPSVLRGIPAILAFDLVAEFASIAIIACACVILVYIAEITAGILTELSVVVLGALAIAIFGGIATILTIRHGAVLATVAIIAGACVVLVGVSLIAIGCLAELAVPVLRANAIAVVGGSASVLTVDNAAVGPAEAIIACACVILVGVSFIAVWVLALIAIVVARA
jgi:hypothetical protein